MSTIELKSKVQDLRELRRMAEELEAEISSIQDTIKVEMTARSVDELAGDDWRITWKPVTSSRLDTAALRSMILKTDAEIKAMTDEEFKATDEQEAEFIRLIREMTPEQRKELLNEWEEWRAHRKNPS